MDFRQAGWSTLAWCALQACTLGAHADQPGASSAPRPEAGTSAGAALEEIIVTATKRNDRLQDVPLSISALSARDLQEAAVKTLVDVAAVTPGVEFDRSAGGPLTNIAVRGVNSTVGASTTGIYIDETAIQSRVTSASAIGNPLPIVFDLQRVEVDRGPQGTLFGAGAEGGALRFITSDPELDRWSGHAATEVAQTRYGGVSYEAGVAAGGPIVDNTVGLRASAWYRRDGGYIDRVDPFNGETVDANSNHTDSKSARISVLLRPVDWLSITPSIHYQKTYAHDIDLYYPSLSNPDAGEFNSGKLLQQPTSDEFTLSTVKMQANVGFADLTSITSYFDRIARTLTDTTQINGLVGGSIGLGGGAGGYGNPLGPAYPVSYADAAPQSNGLRQRVVSEEFRLASSDGNARLSWVAGLFYSYSKQGRFWANRLALHRPLEADNRGARRTDSLRVRRPRCGRIHCRRSSSGPRRSERDAGHAENWSKLSSRQRGPLLLLGRQGLPGRWGQHSSAELLHGHGALHVQLRLPVEL
jgi:iron complex outermembrane receptor protein